MFTLDDIPVQNNGAIGRLVDDKAVIIQPGRGLVKVVNEVGTRIWSLSDGTHSIRDLIGVICQEYEIESEQAESDVLEFVADMVQKEILSILQESK